MACTQALGPWFAAFSGTWTGNLIRSRGVGTRTGTLLWYAGIQSNSLTPYNKPSSPGFSYITWDVRLLLTLSSGSYWMQLSEEAWDKFASPWQVWDLLALKLGSHGFRLPILSSLIYVFTASFQTPLPIECCSSNLIFFISDAIKIYSSKLKGIFQMLRKQWMGLVMNAICVSYRESAG